MATVAPPKCFTDRASTRSSRMGPLRFAPGGTFSTGVSNKTHLISILFTVSVAGVAKALYSGGERANEKIFHRAYSGGEMDGENDTVLLIFHASSTCFRSAAEKGLIDSPVICLSDRCKKGYNIFHLCIKIVAQYRPRTLHRVCSNEGETRILLLREKWSGRCGLDKLRSP